MNLYRVAYTHLWKTDTGTERAGRQFMTRATGKDMALTNFIEEIHRAILERHGDSSFIIKCGVEDNAPVFSVMRQYTWETSDSYEVESIDFVCV